jgi:ABC-2 type transport system permease protein
LADIRRFFIVSAAALRASLAAQTAEALPNVLYVLSLLVGVSSQIFFAKLVDSAPNEAIGIYQGHFAIYLLLGAAMLDLQNAIVAGLPTAVRDAQRSGSLEGLLATPAPRGLILFALALPAAVASLLRLALYSALGWTWFGLSARTVNVLGLVAVLGLAQLSFAAFALIGAGLTMLFRRGDPVSRLLMATSVISGGVFYPPNVLPSWLARAGVLLPIRPALDGLRAAMLRDASIQELAPMLQSLCVSTLLLAPLGAWFFRKMLSRAREDGSLTAW